ncbi:MAG: membrane dipeptidase [Chloroflexi bacterium]|nr:membrane dipeptidase [Chloroflexota bacterium]
MAASRIPLAQELDRVPSMTVPLDAQQEQRFQRLMDEVIMIDVHQHPFICPEDMTRLVELLRGNQYKWGYEAVRHGGWTAVATANAFRGFVNTDDMSFTRFEDLMTEVSLMLSDLSLTDKAVQVGNADDIEAAKQQGTVGFLPTLEHLAIGSELDRVDAFYGMGVRLAGLTYNRKNYIGDGQNERNDGGLSVFGIEVVDRMNQLGMAIDVSHASFRTAMDAIHFSQAPVTFSHNAAYTLRPTTRTRNDEELSACAEKGGLIAITAVPNALSDDPEQNIDCVLDHYDYMVKLVGVDHVGIGTDTNIGDHVAFHRVMLGRDPEQLPAPYLDGLESPADGKNIIRGLIRRGYSDDEVKKLAGGNALQFFRRVMR